MTYQTIGGKRPIVTEESVTEVQNDGLTKGISPTITRILTKSSKNFKQNPAKFKLPSDEEQRKETDDGLKTDEDL